MYLTFSTSVLSTFSESFFVVVSSLAHFNVASKCCEILFFEFLNFFSFKNSNELCEQPPRSPSISTKALFPFPLLPIIDTRPELNFTSHLSNQVSFTLSFIFLTIIESIILVFFVS